MSSDVMNFKRNLNLISLKIHANNKQNLVRRSSNLDENTTSSSPLQIYKQRHHTGINLSISKA